MPIYLFQNINLYDYNIILIYFINLKQGIYIIVYFDVKKTTCDYFLKLFLNKDVHDLLHKIKEHLHIFNNNLYIFNSILMELLAEHAPVVLYWHYTLVPD